ncbi:MAG: Transposase IS200 like protein [candidate division WS2 bacterium ADurb.Bin280]|uniref:Transposase IS200 like protein n=1 Tax=candidate division WS2 bacterium ADurb.Bin280 TaxID=1852829 RepID=A0A1V5SFF0_9BACT|nr:MAG: Transposase IS200 like protein [candidate division WS2 bacterium ADurb.Bin280]
MQVRKDELVNGQIYHVFSRSIAGFVVFNTSDEYARMIDLLDLFRYRNFTHKYAIYKKLTVNSQIAIRENLINSERSVEIIAYCIMPTHIHLVLKQIESEGISKFLAKVLNSYSRYFNTRHKRTGPLWEGRFKSVLVDRDEQLLHLTRYLHLNPTSAGLVDNPEDWDYSSYNEYIDPSSGQNLCDVGDLFDLSPDQYQLFVNERKDDQKTLSLIKAVLIDNYSG